MTAPKDYIKIANDAFRSAKNYVLYPTLKERIVCKDGFSFSMQASKYHYCSPRECGQQHYSSFEIGNPSKKSKHIHYYAEEKSNPTHTIYPFVPAAVIGRMISYHGGIL